MEPSPCNECSEDAFAVQLNSMEWFVRVRRLGKCKRYKPGGSRTCQTEVLPTALAAVSAWNKQFGMKEESGENMGNL